MDIELKEIRDFLASIPPFDRLPLTLVKQLTHETSIRYIRRGMPMPPRNVTPDRLYVIRKGAIAIQSTKGKLLGKLSDGDICTIFCMEGDQDNGLIISEDLAEKDKPWFEALAKYVCDGLNDCGFVYCPGNVMAINAEWRQTESVWTAYFNQWINQSRT
jgi:signal-transduction protein with cAMP-binding, CBS, and nucleotidyltransferase domain